MSELEQKTRQRLKQNAFMQHNYIELESVEPDRAVFRLDIRPESRNPYGLLHGGAIYTMADNATGAAAQLALSQTLPGCLLCSAGVLGMIDAARILRALFVQMETLDVLLQVAASEILVSLCFTPVIYLLFRMVFRRVGGTKLA